MSILVTGGAGFIGANFILDWLATQDELVVNLDKLTYAGNLNNLTSIQKDPRHTFVQGDIANSTLVLSLLKQNAVRAIIHFAAESHVDHSIHSPENFMQTNILGTFHLLEAARTYWSTLEQNQKNHFRFLHTSTDEVYGSLQENEPPFKETSPHAPNNPYSASKAASDHLVRAYYHTYQLPVLTTHCSNNYGPYHFPEKLIPLTLSHALLGKSLPIYGNGQQIRDWLYVQDHCRAIRCVLQSGLPGETYNIGSRNERTNLEVVTLLCTILDKLKPRTDHKTYTEQIMFVEDRLGHDQRYALDASKIQQRLGWAPQETFETGLQKTILWYLHNTAWLENCLKNRSNLPATEILPL